MVNSSTAGRKASDINTRRNDVPNQEGTSHDNYGMQIERLRGDVMTRLGVVDTRLEAALLGVSNFRAFQEESRGFQAESREFFTEYKTEKATREADLDRNARAVRDTLVIHDKERATSLAAANLKKENRRKFWNTLIAVGLLFFAGLSWYDHTTSEKSRLAIMQAVEQRDPTQSQK